MPRRSLYKTFKLAYRSDMETNSLPLTSTIPAPHYPHWTTSEGVGSEYMLSLSCPDHPKNPPSFNFTGIPLRSYQSPHLGPSLTGQHRSKTVSTSLALEPSHAPLVQRHFGSHENPSFSSPNGPHYHNELPLGEPANSYLTNQLVDNRENAKTGLKPPTKML
ncbi:uncharacterized protein N7529_007125 [Penicillium soppii]|uniref:uncharacterized protein n=1 Tax=Penicillium soppii TaxID=69789 RepID=UPI0025475906|nr:uncharacterized protein N7529_007125 [Penicillium soppii]KAJ5865209.1 hypothetical protein N7529_007125 [Penicillium soppii]